MAHAYGRFKWFCLPLLPLFVGCSAASTSHDASSSIESQSAFFQHGGASGETVRFELRPDARVTPDALLQRRDGLALGPKDELRSLRASPSKNGYSTRIYQVYRDGVLVLGTALVLTVHDGYVVEGFGSLAATDERSPSFTLSEEEAWEHLLRHRGRDAGPWVKTSARRVLFPQQTTHDGTTYVSAYRCTYTIEGSAVDHEIVVSAATGRPLDAPRTAADVETADSGLVDSFRRELDVLHSLEDRVAQRPAAAETKATTPRALLGAADESLFGLRPSTHAGPKIIDEAVGDIFELSRAYFAASDGFVREPSLFDWGAAAKPALTGVGHREAAALEHWYFLVAHGAPASADGAAEISGIGVASATLVVHHAIASGELAATSEMDAFPIAMVRSATQLFGKESLEASAVASAISRVGLTTEGLVLSGGGGPGICKSIYCTPQYTVYPADGATNYEPWATYFSISPAPSDANLVEFQVSSDPQFANDADLRYTSKVVGCAQANPFTHTTFVSTACAAAMGNGMINLRPSKQYYWRWRTNPGIATTTWGPWSSPTSFTTAAKNVSVDGPGSTILAARAVFPWGVSFSWGNSPTAQGYDLLVSEDCTFAGPRVPPGAAQSPTDVMDLKITDSNTVSATMDLDTHRSYCWTVVPFGPNIGPSANSGAPAMAVGVWPAAYPAFTTNGAKAYPVMPTNGATGVMPWTEQLKWNSVPHATGYRVDISPADTFGKLLKCTIKAAGQTSCLGDKMKPSTQYFWRVQAQGPTDPRTSMPRLGDYNDTTVTATSDPSVVDPPWSPSTALSFTTSDGVVVLQSPTSGSKVDVSQVKLTWLDNGADSYVVELASVPGQYEIPNGQPNAGAAAPGAYQYDNVQSGTSCSNGTCTFAVPDKLTLNTTYYWRVQGYALGVPGAWSNHGNDWSFTVVQERSACVSPCNGEPVDPWNVQLTFKRVPNATKYHIFTRNFYPRSSAEVNGAPPPSWANWAPSTPDPGEMYVVDEIVDASGGGSDKNVFVYQQWVRPHGPLQYESPGQIGAHNWDVEAQFPDGTTGPGFSAIASFVVHETKTPHVNMTIPGTAQADVLKTLPDIAPVPEAKSYSLFLCESQPTAVTPWELTCPGMQVFTVEASQLPAGGFSSQPLAAGKTYWWAVSASPHDPMGQSGYNPTDPQKNNAGELSAIGQFTVPAPALPALSNVTCSCTYVWIVPDCYVAWDNGIPAGANQWEIKLTGQFPPGYNGPTDFVTGPHPGPLPHGTPGFWQDHGVAEYDFQMPAGYANMSVEVQARNTATQAKSPWASCQP